MNQQSSELSGVLRGGNLAQRPTTRKAPTQPQQSPSKPATRPAPRRRWPFLTANLASGLPRAWRSHAGARGFAYSQSLNSFLHLYPSFPRPHGDKLLAMYGAACADLAVLERSADADVLLAHKLRQSAMNLYDRLTALSNRNAQPTTQSVPSAIAKVREDE